MNTRLQRSIFSPVFRRFGLERPLRAVIAPHVLTVAVGPFPLVAKPFIVESTPDQCLTSVQRQKSQSIGRRRRRVRCGTTDDESAIRSTWTAGDALWWVAKAAAGNKRVFAFRRPTTTTDVTQHRLFPSIDIRIRTEIAGGRSTARKCGQHAANYENSGHPSQNTLVMSIN